MPVSTTSDFSLTAQDIVTEARQLLGIHEEDEELQPYELNKGLKSLNILLKSWQGDAEISWPLTEGSLVLTQSKIAYVFGTAGDFTTIPFSIVDMRITRTTTDLQMFRIDRETYYRLPLKTSEGYPTQWFYDRQRDNGTLYIWPAPDATAGTLKFTYRRRILDIDTSLDNLDIPQEWYDAIIWNLAKRMITFYTANSDRKQIIMQSADESLKAIRAFDVGEAEGIISITPGRD